MIDASHIKTHRTAASLLKFARLKDWRCLHTRYDRCAHTFLSAIAFAAAFIFWMKE